MALRKAGIAVQFAGGINTRQDHKQVPTTQLLNLENATFVKETTLAKRNGYSALGQLVDTTSAAYGTPRGLALRGDDLLVFDDEAAYSYRASADRWSLVSGVSSVVVEGEPVARTGTQQWIPDSATRNGVTAIAWEDSRGGVYLSVLEDSSGRILLAPSELDASGSKPRVIEVGEVLLVLWVRAASGEIRVAVVSPTTPGTLPTPSVLTGDLAVANPSFDACPTFNALDGLTGFGANRPGAIAWAVLGGYRVGYLVESGVLGSPVNDTPSVATFAETVERCVAVAVDLETAASVAVIWGNGDQVNGRFHDPEVLTTVVRGATALVLGSTPAPPLRDDAGFRIACEYGPDATLYWISEFLDLVRTDLKCCMAGKALVSASTFDSDATILRGHALLSRAFRDVDHVYATVVHHVRFFPYVAVIRISDDDGIGDIDSICAARLLPGDSAGSHIRNAGTTGAAITHVSGVEARGMADDETYSRRHRVPLLYRIQLDSANGDQFGEIGIRWHTLDFDSPAAYQTAELGRGMYLAGANPQHYDGDRFVEADYHTAPDWGLTSTFVAFDPETELVDSTPGGSIGAGTYLYKFWYEDVDAQGELHPGATSIPVKCVVAAGTSIVTMTIPTYRLTSKRNVRICIARSEANATGDPESIRFFRVSGTDPQVNTGNNRYVANDPTADSVTFVDALADATLITREPLYTNGGILSNDPAPWSGGVLAGGKSRLFWADPSDPHLVRYSNEIRDDFGLEAPVALTLRCDPFGGAIVGIGVMDDVVYVLKETAIYAFGGPGTGPDGGLLSPAAFTPPALVTSDVGCKAPKSITSTPVGIVFQSSKGIMLIDRSRQVIAIGDPVEAFDSQTITRATLLPDRHQIVFLTDDGTTLLYDYERGQWSKYTNHLGLDAVVKAGIYHYLRTDGRVFQETPGEYVDDNSHIRLKIETAWVKMAGYLQGWQRIHHALFIGQYLTSHTLRVRYRIDYQDAYSAPIDIAVDADVSGSEYSEADYGEGVYSGAFPNEGTVYQQRIHINRRCQAISFELSDVEATETFGAAFQLSEMLLTGGILRSDVALPATRSS